MTYNLKIFGRVVLDGSSRRTRGGSVISMSAGLEIRCIVSLLREGMDVVTDDLTVGMLHLPAGLPMPQ